MPPRADQRGRELEEGVPGVPRVVGAVCGLKGSLQSGRKEEGREGFRTSEGAEWTEFVSGGYGWRPGMGNRI